MFNENLSLSVPKTKSTFCGLGCPKGLVVSQLTAEVICRIESKTFGRYDCIIYTTKNQNKGAQI